MTLDIQSQKITVGMIATIVSMAYYFGTSQAEIRAEVSENTKTNATQWRYINENKKINDSVIRLTAAIESWVDKSDRADRDRVVDRAFMEELSNKVSNIQMKVVKIEEKLNK